ncbi:unnamed protein product [Cunninghamella blakesleeana]
MEIQDDETISCLRYNLDKFYYYLPIFEKPSKTLNTYKIHFLNKYSHDILMKGPISSFSTQHSERMHSKKTKKSSKRTNFWSQGATMEQNNNNSNTQRDDKDEHEYLILSPILDIFTLDELISYIVLNITSFQLH